MTTAMDEERVRRVRDAVRDHLESVRIALHREIHDYPRPVAGCDQQFNYLLERRSGILNEIGRLDRLRAAGSSPQDEMRALDMFLAESPHVDDAARSRLRAALLEQVP